MEDFVSMGVTSAHKLLRVIEQTQQVVAIELMCAAQMLEFRKPLTPGLGVRDAYDRVRTLIPKLVDDRVLAPDMAILAQAVKANVFIIED